jgi:hypothetical protein
MLCLSQGSYLSQDGYGNNSTSQLAEGYFVPESFAFNYNVQGGFCKQKHATETEILK